MDERRAILIAGPTASGKTGLAVTLAKALDGVVVNADSMQVYRELRVLSARPTGEQEAEVPHRLFGFVAAAEPFSVGKWLEAARPVLEDAWQTHRVPIVVGGTGLYFKALDEGLAAIPPIAAPLRERWRARLEADGAPSLHAELGRRDPGAAARLEPKDGQRIVRALEVMEATGRSILDWQAEPTAGGLLHGVETIRLVLWPPREVLYARADARFEAMLADGALEEVEALTALGLGADLPVMKALGVRQLKAHLDGQCSMEDAIKSTQLWTRRYAKRQMTWYRSNMIAWNFIETKDMETLEAEVFAILRENELTHQG
jgi:tRNA dimethylallyltransferase